MVLQARARGQTSHSRSNPVREVSAHFLDEETEEQEVGASPRATQFVGGKSHLHAGLGRQQESREPGLNYFGAGSLPIRRRIPLIMELAGPGGLPWAGRFPGGGRGRLGDIRKLPKDPPSPEVPELRDGSSPVLWVPIST